MFSLAGPGQPGEVEQRVRRGLPESWLCAREVFVTTGRRMVQWSTQRVDRREPWIS